MSWINTSASPEYLEAVSATETIESPAVGFAKPVDYSTVAKQNSAIIKQNNTLLYLITQQSQRITVLEENLKNLRKEVAQLSKSEKSPIDLDKAVDSLTKRLNGITLGEQPRRSQASGPIYVFKDPQKIFEQEKAKPSYSK